MNKKKLALEVFNSSEMKKIASLKSVDKAVLIKMIAEEAIREDEINEAPTDTLRRVLSTQLKAAAEDEEKKQAILNDFFTILQSGEESGYIKLMPKFGSKTPEEKEQFYAAGKKYQTDSGPHKEIVQAIINAKSEQDVETAADALADNVESETGIEADTPEGTPEGTEATDGAGESGIVNAVSMLNSSIGYVSIAAVLVPGGQVALPALKALQLPAAVTASILQAAVNGDTAKAVAELVELLPVDKIPGFDKVASKIAQPVVKRLGEELAQSAVKEISEKMIKDLIATGVGGLDKGIKIGEETVSLDSLTDLSPAEAAQLLLTKAGDLGTQLLDYLKDNFLSGEDTPETSAVEIKPLLDRFATFIQRTGVLSEQINYVIQALDLKDTKVFGKSFAQNFSREEIETLKSHFEDTENGALFFKQYFSQDPEFLERFNQALAGKEEPGEEEEEREQTPEQEIMSIPEEEIQNLSNAYDKWLDGFMTVRTLYEQSEIFGGLWKPIKIFAGKAQSDLEQAERAINPASASREEEEAARLSEAPEDENPASMDAEAPEQEEQPDPAPEAEAIPEEEKQEFKRDILETLLVLKRHSDSIADVLEIYKRYSGKLTVGSIEAFRKYGDSNPKSLLYKFVNLLMKDINRLLEIIDTIQPQEKGLAEALLEVEGETFSDKLRMVEAVNEVVVGQTKVLLNLVQKNQSELEPEVVAPEEEAAPDSAPEQTNEITIQEQDVNKALAAREKALEIYAEMAKIKKYFPTVQPLDSEYQLKEVIDSFANVIKIIKDHIATMVRFKDDKNINPSSLESARDGLLTIKKVIMDLFGVADEGKIEAPADDVAAYSEAGRTAMEEEGLKEPTEVEAEWDEDEEEEGEQEEGEEVILNNREAIERHISTRFLPPEMFKEVFTKNPVFMDYDGSLLDPMYDAFTLFIILTKAEDTDGQPLREAEKSAFQQALDARTKESISITDIVRGLKVSGIFDDEEKTKDIIYKVLLGNNVKQKAQDLSFFFQHATAQELMTLRRRLTVQESKYPFRVVMDSYGSFLKTYSDDDAYADDKEIAPTDPEDAKPEEPAGEPEAAQPDEPAADADDKEAPTPVEVDQDSIDALLAQLEPVIDSPETQEKIKAAAKLPEDQVVDAVEELTMDILSGNEWLDAVKQVDLSLPDINLEPESPEVKQAVVDAVKADVEEKAPGIDLSGIDVDSLPELEPDMDEPAKIDMPDSPREIRRQAFNRKIRALKKKAQGRFDIGKVAKVLRDILNVRNINLSEGYTGGLEVKTLQDLHRALVDAEAIGKDEHSMDTAKLVADMMADLGIEFPDANEKRDIEEQLTVKLTPIIKEVLNRTKNG